jgi:transcriptional regulator with XRE-family HTH domain
MGRQRCAQEAKLERHPSGAKVKAAREPTGLSQFDFSKVAGVPFSRYAAIEAGKVVASADEAYRIASALDPDNPNEFALYDAPDDTDIYRGNRGRVAKPLGRQQMDAEYTRAAKATEMAELETWKERASLAELRSGGDKLQRLQELQRDLTGKVDPDTATLLGRLASTQPPPRSVEDLQRERSQQIQQAAAAGDAPLPEHSWRVG